MDSTQARRRPGVTRKRSRSVLPRLNTLEHDDKEKRSSSSAKTGLLGIFKVLLIMIFASMVLLGCVILADKTWLPRFCDQPVIKGKSTALGRIIRIDVCRTGFARHDNRVGTPRPPLHGSSPVLAIVRHGQEIGEDLQDLIHAQNAFFSKAKPGEYPYRFHWQVKDRIWSSYLKNAKLKNGAIDQPKRDLQGDMMQFIDYYSETFLDRDLVEAIDYAIQEFRTITLTLRMTVRDAREHKYAAQFCVYFESWVQDSPLLARFFPRSYSSKKLLATLDTSTTNTTLIKDLWALHKNSGEMLGDLELLITDVDKVKEELQGAGRPAGDMLSKNMVEDVEQHSLDLARLKVITTDLRRKIAVLGNSLLYLRRMIEVNQCLWLSREEDDESRVVDWELAKMTVYASKANLEGRWNRGMHRA